jgi:ABC-type multidrug transport system fused ATPase/permease subunit
LDNNELKSLNLKWLRTHIGIVSQEPILFATTIAENIRYGRDGVTDEEIEAACKMANAHDFILNFPDVRRIIICMPRNISFFFSVFRHSNDVQQSPAA